MSIVVVEYDKKWPDDFLKIKGQLQKVLIMPCQVQHVGSTSIPGMKAKPIIDIDVGLDNWADFETVKKSLASIGYDHEGDRGIKGREAFGRNGPVHNEILDSIDHHLYVCSFDNEEYKRHILFRDYLRSHDEARDKYNQIKEEILKKVGSDNRAGYVQMKEEEYRDFFEEIIEKAKR
ncbi:GrpB family protein [Treponema bryantii]|uniref:GrpB family protein n=1 Tax=Treponema bryantii TaxID=163 RepID=UPI0003B57934|nr:GrpB family protein [Treponema bryantii]